MSSTILELMEERVGILTAAVENVTAHVVDKEKTIELAPLHRKHVEQALLVSARLDLVAVTARQQEAESNWRLIKAHEGELIQ